MSGNRYLCVVIPLIVAILGTTAVLLWAYPAMPKPLRDAYPRFLREGYASTDQPIHQRRPGQDNQPPPRTEPIDLEGELIVFDETAPEGFDGRWESFRGPYRDNVARGGPELITALPEDEQARQAEITSRTLWSLDLGEGYAGAAVREGRVFLLDYDMQRRADMLRCFALDDGRELWRRGYEVPVKRQHGMSRTTPAVTDQYVVTLGPKCHVLCARAETGEFLWGIDLVAEYGSEVPDWYAGQCPLIDRNRVILAPVGPETLLIAVEAETGEVLWETPNPGGWKMTHSSVLPIAFGGRQMFVVVGSGGVAGVDGDSGELLWTFEGWKVKIANIPTPVDLGEGRLFLSGGYGAGSMFLQLVEEDGRIVARAGERLPPAVFGTEQQTPIFFDDHIYGVLPKDVTEREQLTCLDADGRRVWVSGHDDRFGLGAFMIVDGEPPMLLLLNDDGVLTAAEATPGGYRRLWRAKVLDGHESWGPMALADGLLLVRDLTTLKCIDLRADREEGRP